MGKTRKRRTIKSRLSDHPIKEVNWRDSMLELLFLGALAHQEEGLACIDVFDSLKSAVERLTGKLFDGSVNCWNEIAKNAGGDVRRLVESAPAFFAGATTALFRRLPLEGREQVLETVNEPDPGIESDSFLIAGLVHQMLDNRGSIATKAKALNLWARLQPDELESPAGRIDEEIKGLLDGSIPIGHTTIRATWGAFIQMSDFAPSKEWALEFWNFGLTTPCIRASYEWPSNKPWPVKTLAPIASGLDDLIETMLAILSRPSFNFPVSDVLGGLLARLRSLLFFVLSACERDEGEPAEIFLRCLADTNITIRWMLKQDDWTIFLKYKERSYEQDKHAIETLRSAIGEAGSDALKSSVDREYSELHRTSGRWPELMDVTLGPWNDVSIAQMAKDLGPDDEGKYTLVFGRTSESVHGSWRTLRRFHLDECMNPLHNGHYLPADNRPRSAGVTPAVVGLMLVSEAVLDTLRTIAPPEADERTKAEAIMEHLAKWSDEHQDLSIGTWRVDD